MEASKVHVVLQDRAPVDDAKQLRQHVVEGGGDDHCVAEPVRSESVIGDGPRGAAADQVRQRISVRRVASSASCRAGDIGGFE